MGWSIKLPKKTVFHLSAMEDGTRVRKARPAAVTGSTETKLEEEKRRWLPLDVMDIVWLAAFLFVIREFDIIDAVRYDQRIDQSACDSARCMLTTD